MAKNRVVTYEYLDDFDGKPVDEAELTTVTFGYKGKTYEIDLRETNRAKLEKALDPFIQAATLVSGGRGRSKGSTRPGTGSGRSKEELAAAREWLTANGYDVSPRGRIKAEFLEAYDASK